jgi:hypothetical protein
MTENIKLPIPSAEANDDTSPVGARSREIKKQPLGD